MSVFHNNVLAGASGATEASAFQIDRSLRFDSGSSSYLSRTPSSAGNRKTFTFSAWVKRHKFGADQKLFGVNSAWFTFYFTSSDNLRVYYENSGSQYFTTDAVFRDPSAWYHIVLKVDTTQSTASDRLKIYVNNEELTFSATGTTSQNYEFGVNTTNAHDIGMRSSESIMKLDANLADVHFIDGQALAPTDFGEYDSNNVWQPKKFAGTYGGVHDQTETWSGMTSTSGNYSQYASQAATNLFDGDIGDGWQFSGTTASAIFTPTTSISYSSQVRVYIGATGNIANTRWKVNGGSYQSFSSSGAQWLTVLSGSGTFSSFELYQNGDPYTMAMNAIEIDGTLLVDSGVTPPSNGFHLDFSDASSNSALGDDSSGNNNDWTVNNLTAAVISHVSRDSSKISLNNNSAGTAAALVNGTLSYGDVTFNPANAGYVDYDISSYGFSVGDVIGVRYWNAAHAAGQTITATFDQRDSSGNQISGTVADTQTWTQGQKYNDNSGYVFHTLATNFNSLRVTLSNNSAAHPWGIGEIEFAPASDVDSLIDTPTNYDADSGNNGGNYATLNPLDSNIGSNLTNGNLDAAGSSNWSAGHARGTFGLTSGKWYWEVTRTGGSGATAQIGFCNKAFSLTTSYGSLPADSWTFAFGNGTEILRPSGGGTGYFSGSAMGVGDTVGIALDMDAKTAVFYKNGTAGASISLSSTKTGSTDNIDELFPLVGVYNANIAFNGGQRPFAYTPPTGHVSLCTQNLPDPTIADGSTAFDAKLYTGTGSTQSITGLNFSPDFVWIKNRNANGSHDLYDIVRGADTVMNSDATYGDYSGSGRLTSFNSDGFTLGSQSAVNINGGPFVSWNWDGGTSTATNTDGSITANVRANASAGFSVVAVTKSGTGTVGHGLNVKPELIILKSREDVDNWYVHHSALTAGQTLFLNTTAATATSSGYWNNTLPTSTVFSVGAAIPNSNLIAYCFAPVAGYSAFGSYTGNGSSDGPFIFTNFRPRWLLIKNTSNAYDWHLVDTSRDTYNAATKRLKPNSSAAEVDSVDVFDLLSNGFKLKSSDNNFNKSSDNYIYVCFAEHPFKTARAR